MDEKTDGQTDMTKSLFAFSNFANEPKNEPKTTIHKIQDPDILNFCILRLYKYKTSHKYDLHKSKYTVIIM